MRKSVMITLIVVGCIIVLLGCGCAVFFGGAPKHDDIIMIGHRGYSSKYPDNTEVSFIQAAKHGSRGVETDVRITKDGKFILSHDGDATFEDGTTLVIADSTYDELTAKYLQNKKSGDKVKLCSLQRYLEICKEYGLVCFIELKGAFPDDKIEEAYRMFDEVYDVEKCIMQSFVFENLINAQAMCKRVFPTKHVRFMLTWGTDGEDYSRCFDYGFDIDVDFRTLNATMVREFHERDLQVAAWTCNEPISLHWCYWHKIDYIESDVY